MGLSSRTIWVLGILGLGAILIVSVYVVGPSSPNNSDEVAATGNAAVIAQVLTDEFSDQDRDEDGLRDWEETLWNTDPENPDSDGDGTLDGSEVDQNRNPAVAGPDDTRNSNTVHTATREETRDSSPKSATDVLAQQFFTDYITLRQSGQLEQQGGQEFLLQQIGNNVPSLGSTSYGQADITVVPDSAESARAYGNALASLFLTSGYSGEKDEIAILEDVFIRGRQEELGKLREISQEFDRVTRAASNLAVPRSAGESHLQLLNGLSNVESALKGLENTYEDPLTGLASLQLYQASAEETAAALRALKLYFAREGVNFRGDEPGAFFLSINS